MIGVQAITGGLIGLVVIAGLSVLVIGGVATAFYFFAHKRYVIGASALGISILLAPFPVSGWMVVFKSTPVRNLAIDFRSQVSTDWTANAFQSCGAAIGRPTTTECGSSDHINKVRIVLPDGIELATVAKLVSISFDESRRLTAANLVLHPYMEASAALVEHAALEARLINGASNANAASAKSRELKAWLKDGSKQEYVGNYVCFKRAGYDFCSRYKPPYSGQQYTVVYEIAARK